jgi:cytochrome c oxidase subunit 3
MGQATNLNQTINGRIHPKLFLLYLSFGSMLMLFSAFCSALIVRKGDIRQAWIELPLPNAFLYSTFIIIVSSITMHLAYKYIETKQKFIFWSSFTLLLSFIFVGLQLKGWNDLQSMQIFLNGNPSGSFIYVISWVHGLHYLGGIIAFLLIILNFRRSTIGVEQKMTFNILMQYWHFIGLVWVSLYLFFKFIIYK